MKKNNLFSAIKSLVGISIRTNKTAGFSAVLITFLFFAVFFSCVEFSGKKTSGNFTLDKDNLYIIDNFSGENSEDLNWWTYADDKGSRLTVSLLTSGNTSDSKSGNETENGIMEINVSILAGGYGGVETEFGEKLNFYGSKGLTVTLKSNKAGIPFYIVVWISDPTQTSPLVRFKTPFKFLLKTTKESIGKPVTYILPWDSFKRSTWVGNAGIRKIDPSKIIGMEIAFENENSSTDINGKIFAMNISAQISRKQLVENSKSKKSNSLNPVKINQLGYEPEASKYVYSSTAAWKFNITNTESGKIVYSGSMEYLGYDNDTEMDVYRGDFSNFTDTGEYTAEVVGLGKSSDFKIKEGIFAKAANLSSMFYYFQRSGIDVELPDGEIIKKGHTLPAVLWDKRNIEKNVAGGWYDAGDYGRYIPTAAFSVMQLMYAAEFNPDLLTESGNGMPDLLDEIKWELEWMLKMQRDDGAVYHKVTTKDYPEMGLPPSNDKQQLYLFGPTTSDTAFFTAAMAKAASIYKNLDAAFADKCARTAEKSYQFLKEHPEQIPRGGFKNPPPSKFPMQGGYDFSGNEKHSRMWAAAEIYALKKDQESLEDFKSLYTKSTLRGNYIKTDWADPYNMALYAYIKGASDKPEKNSPLYSTVLNDFLLQADSIAEVSKESLFRTALKGRKGDFAYVWGSNQVVSANGVHLAIAYILTGKDIYRETAYQQAQYLLGCNSLSKLFLSLPTEMIKNSTNSGPDTRTESVNPVRNPHHNLSIYLGYAVPGIVSEGPNGAVKEGSGDDPVLNRLWRKNTPPALCYKDDSKSWATNEPTIDANASFTALMAFLDSVK